jgi:hypothetical protein
MQIKGASPTIVTWVSLTTRLLFDQAGSGIKIAYLATIHRKSSGLYGPSRPRLLRGVTGLQMKASLPSMDRTLTSEPAE